MPPLEGYDLVMLGILAVAAVIGFFKGFVWQLAWIVGIVVSGFVAIRFGSDVAPYFGKQPPWNKLVAMLALYAASSVVVGFVFKGVAGLIDKVHLSSFDHQLGLVFGAAKGLLMCIVVTFFAVTLAPDYRPQIVGSKSGQIMADLIVRADALLPPDIHELVEPFIKQFEENLGSPSGSAGAVPEHMAMPASPGSDKSPLTALWQGVTSAAAWGGTEGASPAADGARTTTDAGAGSPAVPSNASAASPSARVAGAFLPASGPNAVSAAPSAGSLFARPGASEQPIPGAGGAAAVAPPRFAPPPSAASIPSPPVSNAAAPGPFPAGAQTPLPLR
ncbi:MAG: CvpA family protein [Planctomycetaceae bacterium]